jgi:membrane dipeptidase
VRFFRFSLAGVALFLANPQLSRAADPALPVVDLHVDLSYQHNYQGKPFAQGVGQFPVTEFARAGVSGVVLPLFVPRKVSPSGPRMQDLESSYARVLSALYESGVYAPPGCTPVPGKVQTFLAFEGAGPLAENPESLTRWVARGLKIVGLVHTWTNQLASSSGDPKASFGLTQSGREIVRRAFGFGIAVDVSHASDLALEDVIALARKEKGVVVATHSNARALADHPRNLRDEQIRAIAATGGVIGVNFHGPFVVRGRPATLDDVVLQVRHLLRVAGEDHVALGSDFEGDIRPATGLASIKDYPKLEAALAKAGISRTVIAKVFAGNALRVLCTAVRVK